MTEFDRITDREKYIFWGTAMRCRFDLRKYCFTNRIVNMWNSLPDNVILADNVNKFKNRLDKHWKMHDIVFNYRVDFAETGGLAPSNTQILVQYWCHIFPILNVVVTLANFRQHITDICPILSNWCLPILAIQYSPNILYQYVSPLFRVSELSRN